jgi:hypothetical protein
VTNGKVPELFGMVWVLAHVKVVTNSFGKRNFMQPMGRLSTHKQSSFFLVDIWGMGTGRGERDFLFFSLLPKLFPNMFLKMFLIAPWFYPVWFAQSCLLVNCIGGPKGLTLHLDIETFILGESSKS